MDEYPVIGQMRFRQQNFERDYAFVKTRVARISEAQLKSVAGQEQVQFWWADFAATAEQWRILEPELAKRDVFAKLDETVQLVSRSTQQNDNEMRRIESKGNWQLLYAGLLILYLLLAILLPQWLQPFNIALYCIVLGIILVLMLAMATLFRKQWDEQWITRRIQGRRGGKPIQPEDEI